MSNLKTLMSNWALPDRTQERVQITLRLNYNDYARLHALKQVYPNRAVNDFLNDIIHAGLDEVVDAFPPSWVMSDEEAAHEASCEEEYEYLRGSLQGPRVTFDRAYRMLLESKSQDETKDSEAS